MQTRQLLVGLACAVLLCLVSVTVVRADLPVHCLNVQVAGTWLFELGADNHDNSLRCGHHVPDQNADHFTKKGYNLEVVKTLKLQLNEPNLVQAEGGESGTWTMVYDEGFEVTVLGKKFFAFNKYVPKTPESLKKDDVEDYISICNETLVGWFHNVDGSHWGCYHGKRVGGQNVAIDTSQTQKDRNNIKVVAPPRFQQTQSYPYENVAFKDIEADALFEPNYSFIEAVNTAGLTWKAGVHKNFVGRRMQDMMRMLGGRSRSKDTHRELASNHHEAANHRRNKPASQQTLQPSSSSSSNSPMPEKFDWRNKDGKNYITPVKNQGNCGSCYSMATISVAEARLRIKTNLKDKTLLSSQAVVSCSIYNQGCDGGYPFLVSKHGQDYGLVPESCMPYTGSDNVCKLTRGRDCDDPNNPRRYFVRDYQYVGGYYGACNEELMMRELYENGPLVVAFEAPSSLFYYTGGVFTGEAPPHEGPKLKDLNPWEKTNHAVVAVGWGVENGVKYWIIKNTWGADWGENGYFRIRRGTDECAIESMAESLDIVPPNMF